MPKLREGTHFPDWLLEPRRRAEQAFVSVVAECYVRGVSTRRVEGLVRTLRIERLSKSQVSRMAGELDHQGRAAVIRLVGMVLCEQNNEWAVARRYMSAKSLATARLNVIVVMPRR